MGSMGLNSLWEAAAKWKAVPCHMGGLSLTEMLRTGGTFLNSFLMNILESQHPVLQNRAALAILEFHRILTKYIIPLDLSFFSKRKKSLKRRRYLGRIFIIWGFVFLALQALKWWGNVISALVLLEGVIQVHCMDVGVKS